MDKLNSITTQTPSKFGYWEVNSFENVGTKAHHRVSARCVCGKTKNVLIGHLRSGKSLSCGCKRSNGHGMSFSKTYSSWLHMRNRCNNKNNDRYHQYGGRGISVCERWASSFENFIEDMGECPESHSIGRIDNNGNYCKENCRWETNKQQMRNRSNTILVLGEDAASQSEKIDMNYATLVTRIKRGWSEKDAMETPVFRKEDSVIHIARQKGLPPHTIDCRVRRGWDIEKALSTPIKKKMELKSISEECGIPADVLSNRLLRGWSMERATTQPVRKW